MVSSVNTWGTITHDKHWQKLGKNPVKQEIDSVWNYSRDTHRPQSNSETLGGWVVGGVSHLFFVVAVVVVVSSRPHSIELMAAAMDGAVVTPSIPPVSTTTIQ